MFRFTKQLNGFYHGYEGTNPPKQTKRHQQKGLVRQIKCFTPLQPGLSESVFRRNRQSGQPLPVWSARSHLMYFLASVGGVGGGRGLLELSSRWWRGELGMGSRRVGWAGGGGGSPPPEPETATPMPAASVVALTLEELLNLLLDVFSFFLFCYTENK